MFAQQGNGVPDRVLPLNIQRELVDEAAKSILDDLAPEELLIFDDTAQQFWTNPDEVLSPNRRGEVVGFGMEAALLTPLVLAVARPVVNFLANELGAALKESAGPKVASAIRHLFGLPAKPGAPTAPAIILSPDQLASVRKAAFDQAIALGEPDPRAALLADAIVGRMLGATPA